jgi:hypothetical protein
MITSKYLNVASYTVGLANDNTQSQHAWLPKRARPRTHLVDPVRVEHAQVRAALLAALFGHRATIALRLDLVHTLVLRLAHSFTEMHLLLAATATHANAVDHVTLLRLVAKPTCLVRPRRSRRTVAHWQISAHDKARESKKANAAQKSLDAHRYSQQRMRNKNRSTSDCFFLYNSYVLCAISVFAAQRIDKRTVTREIDAC